MYLEIIFNSFIDVKSLKTKTNIKALFGLKTKVFLIKKEKTQISEFFMFVY